MSFLQEDVIESDFGSFDISLDNFTNKDSYNEIAIVDKIKKLSREDQKELQILAAHAAIIGVGKKSFGQVILEGTHVDVEKLIKKHKIKISSEGADLKEDDITLRRLTRVYRYHIKKFIENNNCVSYLFKKYSNHEKEFRTICFSGAEHLVETEKEIKFLGDVYRRMDTILNTSFINRYNRVIVARGLGEKLN
jgi:hypothetical protein